MPQGNINGMLISLHDAVEPKGGYHSVCDVWPVRRQTYAVTCPSNTGIYCAYTKKDGQAELTWAPRRSPIRALTGLDVE